MQTAAAEATKSCDELQGRMRQICEGTSGLPFHSVNSYRERWGVPAISAEDWAVEAEKTTAANQGTRTRLPRNGERVGDELKKLIAGIVTIKTGTGCQCDELANKMNGWRIEGCIQRREEIIGHLVSNKDMLIDALKHSGSLAAGIAGVATRFTPDILIRKGAATLLDKAIDNTRKIAEALNKARKANQKTVASRQRHRHGTMRVHSRKITPLQNQLFAESTASLPTPDPFETPPVFNLVFHLWPVRGHWEWHVDRLNQLIPKCHGQIIIGIAIDRDTVSAESVKQRLLDRERITFIEVANSGVSGTEPGELKTASRAFEMIDTSIDSITLYAHGKGMRPHTRISGPVRLWTEQMYETVTFNHRETVKALEMGYKVVGSFKTFGNTLTPKHKWHYSGTFFNFRTKLLKESKPFKKRYGGTESWPGDNVSLTESYCVFRNNSAVFFQYQENNRDVLVSSHLEWQKNQFDGVPMEQHRREYEWLVNQLADCKSLLIIGSRHGGLEHHLQRDAPQLTEFVSVDMSPLPDNKSQNLIVGSSHDESTADRIREYRQHFDAVFIDGDHTEAGAFADWKLAKTFDPKRVFFHDYIKTGWHVACDCFVDRAWQRIKNEVDVDLVEEFSVGCGWGGISQVTF